jgi:pimeloyl-ACP methyl ester carboxylesterase
MRALQLFGPDRLGDDEWIAGYLALADRTPVELNDGLVGQQLAGTAYDDRLEALAGAAAACLVLGFELDVLTPPSLGRELADAIPDARYVELAGCGHGGLWEQPHGTARIITVSGRNGMQVHDSERRRWRVTGP